MVTKDTVNCIKQTYGTLQLSEGSAGFDIQQAWLIKQYIPSKAFGVIYGASGSYKSFAVLDMCCCLAANKTWNTQKVEGCAVVFIAAEGAVGIKRRIRAWEIAHKTNVNNLFVLDKSLSPSEPEERIKLVNAIFELEKQHSIKIGLIVFDTLSRCFIGDENTARDMGHFILGCETLIKTTTATVLCIHHSGKDQSKGCRGSSKLFADADFVFQLQRPAGTSLSVSLVNHKQKDDEPAKTLGMIFEKVTLGIYCDEGQPVSSLVRIDQALTDSPDNIPENTIVKVLSTIFDGSCNRSELRNAFFPKTTGNISARERTQFSRILKKALESGQITIKQISTKASDSDQISLVH
ncbi:helicase RepA family protein [Shewanella schlegeliana]|uniref:AAA family ATPase n=1 Tax=Shewanella schlegeliana TaxID=190308 RepID=A0ABS1SW91_9GAMM|nr:AAA family ATPase [Shewanella schlegeliana]MBL4912811.1 AAA family ATPase [Shewanella schlegeliana]MCL1109091.1 helicase RepA family protein [Shewanella schlegeliana]GIU23050.1 hypothetical protein TUM4433_04810 [Shewanella schlegeliana]